MLISPSNSSVISVAHGSDMSMKEISPEVPSSAQIVGAISVTKHDRHLGAEE